jgi:hypothetical protein
MAYNISKKVDASLSQDKWFKGMNGYADRAVSETIRTLYAQIGTDRLKEIIAEAEKSGDKYTTLADLIFKAHEGKFPEWRKKRMLNNSLETE